MEDTNEVRYSTGGIASTMAKTVAGMKGVGGVCVAAAHLERAWNLHRNMK